MLRFAPWSHLHQQDAVDGKTFLQNPKICLQEIWPNYGPGLIEHIQHILSVLNVIIMCP